MHFSPHFSRPCFALLALTTALGCIYMPKAKAEDNDTGPTVPISVQLEPRIEDGKQIYEPPQFERFAPRTALDMVRQIPGFTISGSDGGRGLGEANQNVIINGRRISGKSNDAQTVLGRTPVANVVRLEILDGASLDIAGLTGQVLNLVTRSSGITGSYRWRPLLRSRGIENHWFNSSLSISGPLAKGEFTLELRNNNNAFRGGQNGGDVSFDGDGNFLNSRERTGRFAGDRPTISGSYSSVSKNGNIFNLNGEFSYNIFRGRNDWIRRNADGSEVIERGRNRNNRPRLEVSGDYEFALGSGRLKLIGLQQLSRLTFSNLFREDPVNGDPPEGVRFSRQNRTGESVGRIEYRWKGGEADWQLSAEGAFNFLKAQSELEELDMAGIFQPETLDDPFVEVTEKRGEVILSYGRPLAPNLTIQSSLGAEYSILQQTGSDTPLTRRFIRPKGSASLAWNASKQTDLSLRLSREVGQLNFGDFLASVDVQNDNDNAGNNQLVPPQSWLAEVEVNHSLGKSGSIKLQLEGELISDIVDQIPVDTDGDGFDDAESIGNLPSARRASVELTSSFLLDELGWKGAKFDIGAFYQWSALRDLITGQNRRRNMERIATLEMDLRHDVPGTQWAWGAGYEYRLNSDFFRLNFFLSENDNDPRFRVFLEHKDLRGLKVRGTIGNILGGGFLAEEIFFAERREGPVDFRRFARGTSGPVLRLDISGTF